ncbi:O-antigen ligase family protein [Patescibacteria group bacterium]|nr:O-antigen ligase family protein [Patescibacteria group bacterium]
MEILIVFYAIFFLFLAVQHLNWAVMFIIIALPSYLIRFHIFSLPINLLELMIMLAFFVWFVANYYKLKTNLLRNFQKDSNKIKIDYPFKLEIILLLIISFVAVAVAGFSSSSLGIWKAYFFEPILFFILVLNVFKNEQTARINLEKILWSLTLSALIVSIFAIYQKITGAFIFNEFWASVATRRVTSFFNYPNAVGLYLGPIILILIGWLTQIIANQKLRIKNCESKIKQILEISFIFVTVILSLLAIYFAKSEGAMLGVIIGLIIFGLLINKKSRLTVFLFIIIFSSSIYVYSPAKNYLITKITLSDLSGQIRQQQWEETLKMLKDKRIISGAGLANYQKIIQQYHREGIFFNSENDPDFHRKTVFNEEYKKKHWQPTEIYLYPHNIILNFWSELGLAGLLLFIWIIGKYFYLSIINLFEKKNKYLILGLFGAMIVIVVHGLVDVPYFKNDLAILFWLLIAMMGVINFEKQVNGSVAEYHIRQ